MQRFQIWTMVNWHVSLIDRFWGSFAISTSLGKTRRRSRLINNCVSCQVSVSHQSSLFAHFEFELWSKKITQWLVYWVQNICITILIVHRPNISVSWHIGRVVSRQYVIEMLPNIGRFLLLFHLCGSRVACFHF